MDRENNLFGFIHEFQGRWITTGEFAELKPVNVFHRQLDTVAIESTATQNSHILFRRHFCTDAGKKTTIFISADDYYKLYINGTLVCKIKHPPKLHRDQYSPESKALSICFEGCFEV